MKRKIKWLFISLMLLVVVAFLFTGCDLIKKVTEDVAEKAEVASKALSENSYSSWQSGGTKLITIGIASSTDLSGSAYSSYISGTNSGYFKITFDNEKINYDEHDVTISGDIYFGYAIVLTETSFTLYFVEYGSSVDITVDGTEFNNVEVDLLMSFSFSTGDSSVTAKVEGHVGDYTVDTNVSVAIPTVE